MREVLAAACWRPVVPPAGAEVLWETADVCSRGRGDGEVDAGCCCWWAAAAAAVDDPWAVAVSGSSCLKAHAEPDLQPSSVGEKAQVSVYMRRRARADQTCDMVAGE
jgi:hypothetical protein